VVEFVLGKRKNGLDSMFWKFRNKEEDCEEDGSSR
jgi:hypothetical protein